MPFDPGAVRAAILKFCKMAGASETSGYRTRRHNAALVGSVPDSPHTWGLAADVVYDVPPVVTTVDQLAADLGLELIHEKDHDHIQPRGWKDGAR